MANLNHVKPVFCNCRRRRRRRRLQIVVEILDKSISASQLSARSDALKHMLADFLKCLSRKRYGINLGLHVLTTSADDNNAPRSKDRINSK